MNYLKSLLLLIIVSFLGSVLQHSIAHTNLAMLYILVVVITAIRWGRGASIFSAILSVLIFDFFFVPPHFSLTVADTQYLIAFATLFVVAIVVSNLTLRAKEQAEEAKNREAYTIALYNLSREAELLREAEKLHAAFLNSISHDLRTPLVTISGSLSSILQNSALNENNKKSLLETAYGESQRLNQLVSDLLDMTRIEAGVLQIRKKSVDVRDLIGTALKQLEISLKSFKVSINVPANLPEIEVDFVLMMRTLVNILDNASKYSLERKEIDISAKVLGSFLEMAIHDRGIGVPPNDLELIFDKFYRVKQPRKFEGTGLGLSVCKGIVEAHNGNIWAENRTGGGNIIKIALPIMVDTKNGKQSA